jgi:hypothetical protein
MRTINRDMTEQQFASELLTMLQTGEHLALWLNFATVASFEDFGLTTQHPGIVVVTVGGDQFEITVTRSEAPARSKGGHR